MSAVENLKAEVRHLLKDNLRLSAEVKRLRQVLEANLLVECDGCKNWLIEEQIMQHPHHTQWGWVCYSCSKLRESDEECADKYQTWTVSLTDDNGIELSQIEYECENQALVVYREMTQNLSLSPPYHGVVLTHHTDWEMTDDGEYLPKSWTTIVPCMHIDTANTLDGEVCLDCGAEGGEEE